MKTITLNEGRKLMDKAYSRTMFGFKYIFRLHNFMKDMSDAETKYVFLCTCEVYKDGKLLSTSTQLQDANHFYNELQEGKVTRIY